MSHQTRTEEVDEAFSANTYEDENGCWIWTGERSHAWGYPVAFIPSSKAPVNVRSWYAPFSTRRKGFVSFYMPECETEACVRPDHQALVERMPIDRVRAFEREYREGA